MGNLQSRRVETVGRRNLHPLSPEREEVEIDFAGAPSAARLPPQCHLDRLEGVEERLRHRGRRALETHDEPHDGVEKVRLLGHADRARAVETRDPGNLESGLPSERGHGLRKRRRRVADVGTEPDVRRPGPNEAGGLRCFGHRRDPIQWESEGRSPIELYPMIDVEPRPNEPNPVEVTLREMIASGGPVPFATFMAVALTHPGGGYYMAAEPRTTPDGDFLTAPELHPIFGHCLAAQIEEIWIRVGRPDRFVVVEYGAGSGSLAMAIVEELEEARSPLLDCIRYAAVELNDRRRAELIARFARAGLGDRLLEPDAVAPTGIVLANEFVDALPVHRLVLRGGRLRERYVDWEAGRFVEVEGPLSDPTLEAAFRRTGIDGDGLVVEIRPGVRRWIGEVATRLARGVVIVIDYGGEPEQLFGPQHPAGTVLAYRRHRVIADVLADPGRQDLTAHVDLADLRSAASEHGLQVLGQVSLAAFLMGCGLEGLVQRAQARPGVTLADLLLLRSAVRRLLDPRLLGGFQVVVLGRSVPAEPPLRGLSGSLSARPAAGTTERSSRA